MPATFFHSFKNNISEITLPDKFTFPFRYKPHDLCVIAAQELQQYLESQTDFEHNFGLQESQIGSATGKMFGVLVVQNSKGTLGYLCAFSGKLANQNHLPHFVPTVFDMLAEDSFFSKGIKELTVLNSRVKLLENEPNYTRLTKQIQSEKTIAFGKLSAEKSRMNDSKKVRVIKRKKIEEEYPDAATALILTNELVRESLHDKFIFKELTAFFNTSISEIKEKIAPLSDAINQLKQERKDKSAALQHKLFTKYSFLNQYGELKNLLELFTRNPPAAAGECAAPKLLQYAFQQQLKPIAMAEFWWGQSPKSDVKAHRAFYPACTNKCKPILKHMLKGIPMDDIIFYQK